MENNACKAVCLAEKENGHKDVYLIHVHQGDGLNYSKCSMCGWIKPESVKTRTNQIKEPPANSAVACRYCGGVREWKGDAPIPDPIKLRDKGLEELHCGFDGAPSPRFIFKCPVCSQPCPAGQPTNRYATALEVYGEFHKELFTNGKGDFIGYCRERLNSENATAHS